MLDLYGNEIDLNKYNIEDFFIENDIRNTNNNYPTKGNIYNSWTIVSNRVKRKNDWGYICQCDCKNTRVFVGEWDLVNNKSKRCLECSSNLIRKGTLALNGIKKCSECYEFKSNDKYRRCEKTKDKLRSNCKDCERFKTIKRVFNIDKQQYKNYTNKINFKCEICQNDMRFLSRGINIDHCHKTGRIRGFLCQYCNLGMGCFEDNISLMNNAIYYLDLDSNYGQYTRVKNKYYKLYDILFNFQNGKCDICDKNNQRFVLDHNHINNNIRGLLCHNCNNGLSNFKDSIINLNLAIQYLTVRKDEFII